LYSILRERFIHSKRRIATAGELHSCGQHEPFKVSLEIRPFIFLVIFPERAFHDDNSHDIQPIFDSKNQPCKEDFVLVEND